MNRIKNKTRKGAALLVVLVVVMVITVVTLGFIIKSDVQLACGENMVRRVETDYAAQAALACSRSYWLEFFNFYKASHLNPGFQAQMENQPVKAGGNAQYDFYISGGMANASDPNTFTYDVLCRGYRNEIGIGRVATTQINSKLHFEPAYDVSGNYVAANSAAFFKSIKKN